MSPKKLSALRPYLYFAAFALAYLALRVFWLDGDPGLKSLWEYGYNVTDEGYYMGAAKDKYLWGAFCDFARAESFTYGYSALTHWLSLVGYKIFGLSDWGWRVPYLLLYFVAWCSAFCYIAKRKSSGMAFAFCLALSSMPVIVAYERTACNDLAIGAIGVIAFVLASGKGAWRIFASALLLGAASLIKPSVWVVMPIVAAAILSERKTRYSWLDVVLFVGSTILSVWAWKSLALLSLLPETSVHNMTASEIIKRTTTHNPLPSITDIDLFLRGFSSFPREICFKAFGGVAALLAIVPIAMAARQVVLRKWNWRLLLFLALPAYAAAVSVNNSICLHYYHPALMMLPILCLEVVRDFGEVNETALEWKPIVVDMLLSLALVALGMLFLSTITVKPNSIIGYFSTISNLPQKVVWIWTYPMMIVVAIAMGVILSYRRGLSAIKREWWAWLLVGFVAASVALAGFPAANIARYVKQSWPDYFWTIALSAGTSVVFILLAFGEYQGRFAQFCRAWFAVGAVILSFVLSPVWRSATIEMLKPSTHIQRGVANEVARLVPSDAVVIGERSRQVLMAKPIRTATTMPGCDPIPIVKKLLAQNSTTPLYALADSQNAYNLQHFREHQKEYRLDLIKTFKMPSFSNGKLADVYLCKIVALPQAMPSNQPKQ